MPAGFDEDPQQGDHNTPSMPAIPTPLYRGDPESNPLIRQFIIRYDAMDGIGKASYPLTISNLLRNIDLGFLVDDPFTRFIVGHAKNDAQEPLQDFCRYLCVRLDENNHPADHVDDIVQTLYVGRFMQSPDTGFTQEHLYATLSPQAKRACETTPCAIQVLQAVATTECIDNAAMFLASIGLLLRCGIYVPGQSPRDTGRAGDDIYTWFTTDIDAYKPVSEADLATLRVSNQTAQVILAHKKDNSQHADLAALTGDLLKHVTTYFIGNKRQIFLQHQQALDDRFS